MVSTTTSRIRSPRSRSNAARPSPNSREALARAAPRSLPWATCVSQPPMSAKATSQPDVGADELGDLPQALAEAAARILRRRWPAARRCGAGGLRASSRRRRSRGRCRRAGRARPARTATRSRGARPPPAMPADAGLARRSRRGCSSPPRRRRRAGRAAARAQRHGPERRGAASAAMAGEPARQPAVGRALHAGRAGLHVVLRVEVRARRVGRAAGVHDGQPARVPQRLERRQRRVQAEEAVEIEGGPVAPRGGRRDGDAARAPRSSRDRRAARTMLSPSTAPRWKTATSTLRPRRARLRQRAADEEARAPAPIADAARSAPPFMNARRVQTCMLISSGTRASRAPAPPACPRRCRSAPRSSAVVRVISGLSSCAREHARVSAAWPSPCSTAVSSRSSTAPGRCAVDRPEGLRQVHAHAGQPVLRQRQREVHPRRAARRCSPTPRPDRDSRSAAAPRRAARPAGHLRASSRLPPAARAAARRGRRRSARRARAPRWPRPRAAS